MLPPLPNLTGDKVRLRMFAEQDIDADYIGWLNDPVVMRFSNQRFSDHDWANCQAYFRSFEATDNMFVSVRTVADDRGIGTMTAYTNRHHGTVDVGILIGAREHWGGGYGQQAWNLLTNWLIEQPAIRKLTAGTLSCNHGMVRLMQRSSMKLEATRTAQEIVDGVPQDILFYARFAASDVPGEGPR